MNLQFVFGNPTKKKKGIKNKSSHGRSAVATRRKKSKGTKKRNPEKVHIRVRSKDGVNKKGKPKYKTVKKSVSKRVATRGELSAMKAASRIMLEQTRGKPAKFRKAAKKRVAQLKKKIASASMSRQQVQKEIGLLKDQAKLGQKEFGDSVVTKSVWSAKKSKSKNKKTKSKKRKVIRVKSKAKKASKKKSKSTRRKKRSGSRKVILARKGSKIMIQRKKGKGAAGIQVSANPGKKKKTRRSKTKRKSSRVRTLTAGKSFSLKSVNKKKKTASFRIKAKNPLGGIMDQFEKYTGHSIEEAGSLALGGALYGIVNSMTAKHLKPVHSILSKVPVVGNALPTLVAGALLNYLGERQGIKALKVLGTGLVGASVVGMGVNASQMVPGLKALAGVDYTMEGIGDDADFGYAALPDGMGDGADFGGVDYTMEGDDSQMGEIPYSGVDYTMEGYGDDADFGNVPEGLGQGQMG